MGWADIAGGVQNAVQRQLMQRVQQQQREAQAVEHQRRAEMEYRSADRADRGQALQEAEFEARSARQLGQDEQAAQQHTATQATALGDQLPPDTFLGAEDPAVGTMQRGGTGSLLTRQAPTQAMGEDFAGPMPNMESPQQAQVGRPGGYLKTRSQKQFDTDADNARQLQVAQNTQAHQGMVDERGAAAAVETGRHNRAMEHKPTGVAAAEKKNWVMRNGQPVRASEAEIQPGDTPYNAAAPEKAAAKAEATAGAEQTRRVAVSTIDRMLTHPGLSKSSGIISSKLSGYSQDATDFNSLRDQVVATLALPNLNLLKGPMSDKDIMFVKQLATRLSNENMSDSETKRALMEAKVFLDAKPGGAPGADTDPLGLRK
jgi:hypothetical protein